MDTKTTQLSPTIELSGIVRNTNAIIEIDVNSAIQYVDSQVAEFNGESEDLEIELKKWFKELSERRLELTRPVNESLKQVIADEKKIGEYLDKIFAENKAKRDREEAARKEIKKTEVMRVMADILNDVDLPPEYLSKIVFKEEYYQKTMINKKLRDSIQEQINIQVNLYNGWLAEQELKQQKIKNRELLIENLNSEFGFTGKYSNFPIETHTDEEVVGAYKSKLKKIKQEQAKQKPVEDESRVAIETTNPDDLAADPVSQQASVDLVAAAVQSHIPKKEAEAKVLMVQISTGNPKADIAAISILSGYIDQRLAKMKQNFAEKYNINLEYLIGERL